MTKQETLQKLEIHLQELQDQFQKIKSTEGKIPKLEMDRLLSEIRASYELFTVLNYLNTYGEGEWMEKLRMVQKMLQEEPVAGKQEIQPQIIVEKQPEPIREEIKPPVQAEKNPVEEIQPETVIEKTKVEEPKIVAEEPQIMEPVAEKKVLKPEGKPAQKEILNDKTDHTIASLGDRFHSSPIVDLKKAIALHEKFQFINELFKGDNVPYNEFIQKISDCKGMQQAQTLIEHYSHKYDWNVEGKTFQKLYQFVQRRHQ